MILFIGPPCCGKGIISFLLCQRNKFKNFSFGHFLRELSWKNDSIGLKVKSIINSGAIVDPFFLFENIDCSIFKEKKLILDGFPRSLEQAIFFENYLKEIKESILCVVEFCVDEKNLIERVKKRKICKSCNNTFVGKICACGSLFYEKRADDFLNVFGERLKNYNLQRNAIFDFYKDKQPYHLLDAFGEVEEVYERSQSILRKYITF